MGGREARDRGGGEDSWVSFVKDGEVEGEREEKGGEGEGEEQGVGEKRESERERRGSSSSTCTLWPGSVVGAEVLFSASAEQDGSRPGVAEGDREKDGLEKCVDGEEDGIEDHLPQLLPGLTAKDGLAHPDTFELDGLEDLAGSADDGFEWQELFMPPRPFPKEGL